MNVPTRLDVSALGPCQERECCSCDGWADLYVYARDQKYFQFNGEPWVGACVCIDCFLAEFAPYDPTGLDGTYSLDAETRNAFMALTEGNRQLQEVVRAEQSTNTLTIKGAQCLSSGQKFLVQCLLSLNMGRPVELQKVRTLSSANASRLLEMIDAYYGAA